MKQKKTHSFFFFEVVSKHNKNWNASWGGMGVVDLPPIVLCNPFPHLYYVNIDI
jgi:hypothetical protein